MNNPMVLVDPSGMSSFEVGECYVNAGGENWYPCGQVPESCCILPLPECAPLWPCGNNIQESIETAGEFLVDDCLPHPTWCATTAVGVADLAPLPPPLAPLELALDFIAFGVTAIQIAQSDCSFEQKQILWNANLSNFGAGLAGPADPTWFTNGTEAAAYLAVTAGLNEC
jgi:hypothetical protein